MSAKKCQHTKRITAKVDLDFARPSESKSRYSAAVDVLICEECGHIELYAALPDHLCVWLEER